MVWGTMLSSSTSSSRPAGATSGRSSAGRAGASSSVARGGAQRQHGSQRNCGGQEELLATRTAEADVGGRPTCAASMQPRLRTQFPGARCWRWGHSQWVGLARSHALPREHQLATGVQRGGGRPARPGRFRECAGCDCRPCDTLCVGVLGAETMSGTFTGALDCTGTAT